MRDNLNPSNIEHQVDAVLGAVQAAQHEAEIKNAAKRQAEREEKMRAWQDPDAMTNRRLVHERQSFDSLQSMKRNGQCEVETPIPPDYELPPEMKGQQPSTIRAWLRSNPDYRANPQVKAMKAKAEAQRKEQQSLRDKYPEMFGLITCTDARDLLAGKETKDYAVRTGQPVVKPKDFFTKQIIEESKPQLPGRSTWRERLRGMLW